MGVAVPSCENGILDGNETDTDCGGASCTACPVGSSCTASADCLGSSCLSGKCAPRTPEETVRFSEEIMRKIRCKRDPTSALCTSKKENVENVLDESVDDVVAAAIVFPDAIFEEASHKTEFFIHEFRNSVAKQLGLHVKNVEVINVYSGSVVVDYVLLNVAGKEETTKVLESSKGYAKAVADDLAESLGKAMPTLGIGIPAKCASVKPEAFNPTSIFVISGSLVASISVFTYVYMTYKAKAKAAKVISKDTTKRKSEIEDIVDGIKKEDERLKRMTAAGMRPSKYEIETINKVFEGVGRYIREVYREDLEFKRVLGSGAFGTVHLASWKPQNGPNTLVAAKMMKREHLKATRLLNVRGEILLLGALQNHPNVIRFIGASWNYAPCIVIVTEYVDGGDLQALIHEQRHIELMWSNNLLDIAIGITKGISHLHAHTYIHRDIKPANVLLTKRLEPKIADLGEACVADKEKRMTQVGTPMYTAPEVLNDDFYDEKIDIYSLGIMLNEMSTREVPYTDAETRTSFFNAIKVVLGAIRPALACDSSSNLIVEDSCERLRELIVACWDPNAECRPSSEEVQYELEAIKSGIVSSEERRMTKMP